MKFEFSAKHRSIIVVGPTWIGYVRLGKDGRWSRRWVKLPWFGYKIHTKKTLLSSDSSGTKTRHVRHTRVWMPFVLFHLMRNTLDHVVVYQNPR